MLHIRDADQEIEIWRPGVRTRMYASAGTGSAQLVVFEQWCDAGSGAPLHEHSVEEVLRVLAGEASITVAGEHALVRSGETVIIPAGAEHAFTNTGESELHTQAILAASVFEAHYVGRDTTRYRWRA